MDEPRQGGGLSTDEKRERSGRGILGQAHHARIDTSRISRLRCSGELHDLVVGEGGALVVTAWLAIRAARISKVERPLGAGLPSP